MDSPLDGLRDRLKAVQIFASPRRRRRFVVHLIVVLVVFLALTIVARRHLSLLTNRTQLRTFIQQYGNFAPLVLIVLQALQVVLAPIPGQVLAVVAGYLFGAWLGTLYNMIGIAIGSTVAFWLSRRYGRAYVEHMIHEDALADFDSISDNYVRATLFLFFLVPGLPDDMLCFAGGLTKVPLWQLVGIAVVGRAPAFFLVNVVGGLLGEGQFVAAAALTLVIVVISALGYLNRDRLIRLLGGDS